MQLGAVEPGIQEEQPNVSAFDGFASFTGVPSAVVNEERAGTCVVVLRPSAVWSESDAQKRRESVWASLPTLQQVVLVLIGARKVGSGESSFTRCQNINNNCSL